MRVVVGASHDPVDLTQADLLFRGAPHSHSPGPGRMSAMESIGMCSQSGRFFAS
jgi:hypothetical protein